ncbi:MAG: guanylate kinase [Terriglobia bacterium]
MVREQSNELKSRNRVGGVIIISAPSGSGKSTVVQRLLSSVPNLEFSVSYTTRLPRPRERDGRDYYFVTSARFREMVRGREFLEWARVHGNFYGTSRRQITEAQRAGSDILLDIDVQGHRSVRRKLPGATSIFLLPPSLDELRRRLAQRHADTPEVIEKRVAAARREIRFWREYDYAVVNDDLRCAVRSLRAVVEAARLRRERQRDKILEICRTFGG